VSELYNDPVVTVVGADVMPWWLAPNSNCQNDLETGDIIENMPNRLFPPKHTQWTTLVGHPYPCPPGRIGRRLAVMPGYWDELTV
jgi:hypothetical protein